LTTATSHPQSTPFLLVRPSDRDVTDVLDDGEGEPTKSVPPRAPPSSMTTSENNLPSVIVDLAELEASEPVASPNDDAVPSSEVDGLLESIEAHASARDSRRVQTLHVIERTRAPHAFRNAAIVVVSACVLAGGAFVGVHTHHLSPRALGAALHFSR